MNSNLPKVIGENILLKLNELTTNYNIKQTEFADKIGISESTLSNICCGKRRFPLSKFADLCISLDTSPDFLFGLEGKEFTKKDEIIDVDSLELSEIIFLNDLADHLVGLKTKIERCSDSLIQFNDKDNSEEIQQNDEQIQNNAKQ